MDQKRTGTLIRALRTQKRMTQRQLADTLGVTDRAVSKWERGLGSPDISLLPILAQQFGIPMGRLLSDAQTAPPLKGGSMKQLNFYVCPHCGSLLTATGQSCVSCCGQSLAPLTAQKADADHALSVESVEDEWYVTAPQHPMEKGHYLSFAALVNSEYSIIIQRWPEWDFQLRLPKRVHGMLYWFCTWHGLFRQMI